MIIQVPTCVGIFLGNRFLLNSCLALAKHQDSYCYSIRESDVSDINQVVGQFNAALERHFVIIMDEAMFSGDRKSQDRMKSLITENTCHIEQKYQPSRTIESFHRFFASSNHEHFSHVEGDDRRSLFVRVSDVYQGDHDYFSQVGVALSDDHGIR